jgi:uncharacterized protein (DUF1501 family)
VLVSIFQRGAADGLNTVVPAGDPFYYSSRPTIAVPAGTELPLDGFFGLNPAFDDLQGLYQSGDLCFLHAAGSPDPSRSHFDTQDFMDRAAPGNKSVLDGWLNRYLAVAGGGQLMAGISLSNATSKSLAGPTATLAFESIAGFALSGSWTIERRAALDVRYGLRGGYHDQHHLPRRRPRCGSQDAAALIKGDIGVRVIALSIGGWDHHTNLPAQLAGLGTELSGCLKAFHDDLGTALNRTLTLVGTEFGRRIDENGGNGADHGHGGVMVAMGGGLAGGHVIVRDGAWPGLVPAKR